MAHRLRQVVVALAALAWAGGQAFAQSGVFDDFRAGPLDLETWCPCQINTARSPVEFVEDEDEPGDRILRIVADEASLGGNKCRLGKPHFECAARPEAMALAKALTPDRRAGPDRRELLGPSLLPLLRKAGPATAWVAGTPRFCPPVGGQRTTSYCTEEKRRRAESAGEEGRCIQRQEIRLQSRFRHPAAEAWWYEFRFRMPESIEDRCNSIRWVTAQWKHGAISEKYAEFGPDWGPSPFLAQRFDDGILHITVQDEHCRCIVASSSFPSGSRTDWRDGTPRFCQSTHPRHEKGTPCTPDLTVRYGADPILVSPVGRWVEMRYLVQARRSPEATIEIRQGDRFIAEVRGRIGYEVDPGRRDLVKFKLGQYRDYMPFVHAMDIDWVRVGRER